MDDEYFNKIFSDYVLLDSTLIILNEYIKQLRLDPKEKIKRIIMIKELAKKKLKTTVIDDITISALIKETNDFYNQKKKQEKTINKSFKDLIYEEQVGKDQEIIKHNYIFNTSIIYVDAFKDLQEIYHNNAILKNLKIGDCFNSASIHNHIFSNAIDKSKLFWNHFNLMKYFVLQNSNFKTKFQTNKEGIEITTLDSLLGNSEEVFVLGMLLINEERRIQLQDLFKIINLDITETEFGKGYFTEGCIVLVQGYYKDDVLSAKYIMHPPVANNNYSFTEKYENDFFGAITKCFRKENEHITPITINNNLNRPEENFLLNFLNRDISTCKKLLPKNLENHINVNLENLNNCNYNSKTSEGIFLQTKEYLEEEFFIVISNPDLTNHNILAAIEKIINGYTDSNSIPFMIVFIGNFVPENSFSSFRAYASCFDNLANIINKNSFILKGSYVVVIPGPDEFSLFSGFPKHPIIETVMGPFKKKVPNTIAASNPCRFSIFGKEIVFFRDNLNKKFARNSIIKSNDLNNNQDNFIHTILTQGNLAPFDLTITPRIWHLDYSISLLPPPDILVLADVIDDFSVDFEETTVINPGNFTKNYSFYIVCPLKNTAELSKVNLI